MQIRELKIPDSYEITPKQFGDDRGVFLEWYKAAELSAKIGYELQVAQLNTSVSRRGVVRGIHYAQIPPSQGKYVIVTNGAVMDYVIDIRLGSLTFGQWDSVVLDDLDRRAIYIAEGLGHCFVALSDNATVSYLVTAPFNPEKEFGINPLDPEIGLVLPMATSELVLSVKDTQAPSLAQAEKLGILPTWAEARTFYASLGGSR